MSDETTIARDAAGRLSTGAIAGVTRLADGVFRVDLGDGGRRTLRRRRLSTEARAAQLEWLRAIARDGRVRAPSPVAIDDEWTLLTWVDGAAVAKPQAFVAPRVLERVGEAVARLHDCEPDGSTNAAPTIDAERLVGRASCLGDGSAARLIAPADLATLVDAAPKIAAAMDEVAGDAGFIHGDLGPSNWVFDDRGVPGVIDFDEFGRGPRWFDLLGVLWSHATWPDYAALRPPLLSGYARPLLPAAATLDRVQAATLLPWLNRGCRMSEDADRAEFLRWVPATVAAIGRLCA